MASDNNKKLIQPLLLLLSVVLLAAAALMLSLKKPSAVTGHLIINEDISCLYINEYDLLIKGTDKNCCTYYFLPSFIDLDSVDQSLTSYRVITPDGKLLEKPGEGEQDILVDMGEERQEPVPWRIAFMKSENLYTVYMYSGEQDLFEGLTKENYEPVSMKVYSPEGRVTLSEDRVSVKVRGNGSARLNKKSLELKFDRKKKLSDLSASKKWAMLANASEDTKLYNKMAFDISSEIGMSYSIESDWADLYENGVYKGNYLICREPDIGKNDLDIGDLQKLNDPFWNPEDRFETEKMKGYNYENSVSPLAGGYLFQILKSEYYENKDCGFKLNNSCFSIKSPVNASREQVEYISGYAEHVDEVLRTISDSQFSVVDVYSFSRRFLIEELFYNLDGFINSYYFYKDPRDDRLYAGPVWDYDTCLGKGGGDYLDYRRSLFEQNLFGKKYRYPCEWDYLLYQNDNYRAYLRDVLKQNIPVFRKLIEEDIDRYYEKTEASIRMDRIVWGRDWYSSPYLKQDSNIRFTKFFLEKRLEWLCERWGIEEDLSLDLSDGTEHEVTFCFPDGRAYVIKVKDGACLTPDEIPEYDEKAYIGWFSDREVTKPFSHFLPVFEDMTLELRSDS